MAAVCDAPLAIELDESASGPPKIPNTIDDTSTWAASQIEQFSRKRMTASLVPGMRCDPFRHTANTTPTTAHSARLAPTTRKCRSLPPPLALSDRVSVLVAALLDSIATTSSIYTSCRLTDDVPTTDNLESYLDGPLARACILTPAAPPCGTARTETLSSRHCHSQMDIEIDFGSTAGFKERAKKKKGGATKFDPWADSDKKDDSAAGDETTGAGDGAAGSGSGGGGDAGGSGGDDENGDNRGDDDWDFNTTKKSKKRTKKKQDEADEEDRNGNEEVETNDGMNAADPLSWANDTNDNGGAGADDWTNSWSTGRKDKKKKNGTATSAAPELPTSAFQEISLDDGALKLDLSFDGPGSGKDTKANAGGLGPWSSTWDFAPAKDDSKMDSLPLGSNNPWSLGTKSKKNNANTMSNFDFGDFGAADKHTSSFGTADDVATNNTAADDPWGFAAPGRKDKKKKGGIEEIYNEPHVGGDLDEPNGGKASKIKQKTTSNFDSDFLNGTTEDTAAKASDDIFDWGFGSKKDKKKSKSDVFDVVTASVDANVPPADGFDWGMASSSKKKTAVDAFGFDVHTRDESPADSAKVPMVAWDDGLSSKDKRKLEKEMKMNGTWDERITQDMVDQQTAAMMTEPHTGVKDTLAQYDAPADKVAWDDGLSTVKKRKKEKEMRENGTWDSRITQEMIDNEKATAAATVVSEDRTKVSLFESGLTDETLKQADALDDLVPWDHGLSPVKKRKKEREMRAEGTWDDRLTEKKIEEMRAVAAHSVTSPPDENKDETNFDDLAEPPPPPPPPALPKERMAWDHGLTAAKKKKKEKEMKLDGTWDSRVTQEQIEEEALAATLQSTTLDSPAGDELLSPPPPLPAISAQPRVAWDFGLNPVKKKRKEREMKLDGTWDARVTQEMLDAGAAAVAPDFPSEVVDDHNEPELIVTGRVAWDHGLGAKDKKKKEREMKFDGTWEDRITQEMVEQEEARKNDLDQGDSLDFGLAVNPTKEERVAWDHGLSAREKKKKEKEMRVDHTWDDRVTQEMLDAANENSNKEQLEAPPDKTEPVQPRVAWDHGLDAKARKKKERDMKLDDTWEQRVTQEMIDADDAATAQQEVEVAPSTQDKGNPPELKVAWDHGLDAKARKKKEREMKLDYTWEDRITQEMIDEENTNRAKEPEKATKSAEVTEPRVPWDHGLTSIQKRKKEKSMRLEGTWEDRLTQEQIDEDAAAKRGPESKSTLQPIADESTSGGWGFGWGADAKNEKVSSSGFNFDIGKDKGKAESEWGGGWEIGGAKEKEKEKSGSKQDKFGSMWNFETDTNAKKKKDKDVKAADTKGPDDAGASTAPVEEDIWAAFGTTSKPDKKDKKSKKGAEDATAHTNLTPDPVSSADPAGLPNIDDFDWDGLGTGRKSNKSLVEEVPAKKSGSSLWGFGSNSTPAKSKKEKEKDAKVKKEAEESGATRFAEGQTDAVPDDGMFDVARKTKSKTGKTASEEKKTDDLLDLLDDPAPATSGLKDKKSSKASDHKVDDYFGAWGSGSTSKKTTGKKGNQEIKPVFSTNDMDDLPELNEDEVQAVLDEFPASSSNKRSQSQTQSRTVSDTKTKTKSSIADRIKAFEVPKESSEKKSKSKEVPGKKDETDHVEPLSPIEDKKIKAKAVTRTTSSKTKDSPPLPVAEKKTSKDSVPGGFPGAFDLDEETKDDGDDPPPVPSAVKGSTKTSKAEIKSTKVAKTKRASVTFDKPAEVDAVKLRLLDDGEPDEPGAGLLTPPPETKTTSKKSRPKVAATSSWGLFGSASTPKKSSKSKPVDDVSPPDSKKAPALTRSKSSRTSKEKATEDKKAMSKSSSSDADSSAKKADKPKAASRGMSFANFMLGGPPPPAMRDAGPLRRSNTVGSRMSSRRPSMDQSGLLSPATDEEKHGKKPSRSLQRKSSTKAKSRDKADVFDDGDIVMVGEDDVPTAKSRPPDSRGKRRNSTKPRSKTISGDEDTVMVDSPGPIENGVLSGGDEHERPALSRSNTAKRVGGLLGSLFGGGARPPARPQSNPVSDAEDKVRSRGTSRRRRTTLDQEADVGTDNPTETDAEAAARRKARRVAKEQAEEDERVAREQRRRERRDREKADLEARRERARDQARKEREAEEAAKLERRARRKAREAEERARLDKEEAEAAEAAERRREQRRRAREKLEADAGGNFVSRDDRRRTFAEEEDTRRARRKEKSGERDESQRKSTALMADYHESRSGSGRGIKPPSNKTSNWVHSQTDELPDPPPLVGTVVDESGQQPRPVEDGDPKSRRSRQHRSSKDKYGGMTEEEVAEYRSKRRERKLVEQEKEKSTSGGSEERREGEKRSHHRWSRAMEDDYYAHGSAEPARMVDGRPGLSRDNNKRGSFLSKFF